jgi:hypothetical protein
VEVQAGKRVQSNPEKQYSTPAILKMLWDASMDQDVFVISAAHADNPAEAIHKAVLNAGIASGRLEDAVFGSDDAPPVQDRQAILQAAGLTTGAVSVSSSLRAVFFAAEAILSEDADLILVVGVNGAEATALVLASPDSVGRWNLSPRARLAARSLAGPEAALAAAGDVPLRKDGPHGAALLHELIDELEEKSARWGLVSVGSLALAVERI